MTDDLVTGGATQPAVAGRPPPTSPGDGGRGTGHARGRRDGRTGRDASGRRTGHTTGHTTGTLQLLGFALRHDRVRLTVWVAAAAAFVGVQSASDQDTFAEPAALAAYARAADSAAVIVMTGRPVGLDSVARAVAFESFGVVAVIVALMSVFTLVRHTRGEEALGRTELVRAGAVGRRAPLLAAVLLVVLADLAVLVAVWAVCVGTGLPWTGSLLLAASLACVGLVFGGVAAVTSQLSGSSRGALAMAGGALGVAFLLRAVGDVRGDALSWLSPIGWAQATYPFHLDRWWPLLLCLDLATVLVGVAVVLQDRRDLGAGMLPDRPGPAAAGLLLSGPLGLAWRLQRGTVVGWTAGLAVTGLAYGSLVVTTEDLVRDTPEILEMIPGGARDVVAGYLVLTAQLLAFLAACAGVVMVLRLRSEELAGRADPMLATPTSRVRWAGSHVAVALGATAAALLLAALLVAAATAATGVRTDVLGDVLLGVLVLLPAAWVLVGLAVALWGADARLGPWAWLGVAWSAVVFVLGVSLDLPGWARWPSPFAHVAAVPLDDATPWPSLVLLAVAAALTGAGLLLWRRRDVRSG